MEIPLCSDYWIFLLTNFKQTQTNVPGCISIISFYFEANSNGKIHAYFISYQLRQQYKQTKRYRRWIFDYQLIQRFYLFFFLFIPLWQFPAHLIREHKQDVINWHTGFTEAFQMKWLFMFHRKFTTITITHDKKKCDPLQHSSFDLAKNNQTFMHITWKLGEKFVEPVWIIWLMTHLIIVFMNGEINNL